MSKYVTTGTGNKHLHSRRNCPIITGSEQATVREASPQEIELRERCKICHVDLVECEYCGETFRSIGLSSHQNHCEENPDRIGGKVPVLD